MDKISDDAKGEIRNHLMDSNLSSVIIAFIIGFILVAIFIIRKRISGRRDFLLIGLCESGKTAIFMQIIYKKFPQTFTSITENVGEYHSSRTSAPVIDIPGHYRVREKFFAKYKKKAKGIIFVVDSVTAQKEIRDVADAFYSVISDTAVIPCSILVLCTKQDLATAKSAQVIRSLLEKEINIVRETRSRKLKSTSEDGDSKISFVGKEGRDFEFSHLPQNVQFLECSAKDNQLNHLCDWIDKML